MTKILIHLMTYDKISSKYFKEELPLLIELNTNYGINNYIFYSGEEKIDEELINTLKNKKIILINYLGDDDLNKKIKDLSKKFKIIFITTPSEVLVLKINELRKLIGQKVSQNYEMFGDKSIQRELLYKNDSDISVKYIKNGVNNLNFDNIKKQIGLPFVLKPCSGAHSAGVVKINNSKDFDEYINNYIIFHEKIVDKGFSNSDEIIAEEYVDGKFYSVDYIVDENGKIIRSNPVRVTLGIDLGINDFFNCSRIISKEIENEIDFLKLDDFISRNVKATGIKNTFIHHEFKINTKGLYKTIEINGRIGGNRLSLYKFGYDLNLLSFIFDTKIINKIYENTVFIRIYPERNGILEAYNKDLFEEIKKLNSFYDINKKKKLIGTAIGLTKYGYEHVGVIRLKNINFEILKKDLDFIFENYKNLLIMR